MTDKEREARLRLAVEVGPYPPIDYWGDEVAFLLRLLDEARAALATEWRDGVRDGILARERLQ
jgi:hypothetical protein